MIHGLPRYDAVLVTGKDKPFFGIFISIFVFKVGDNELHPFALIQPLDLPIGPKSRKDQHLHLYRLRAAHRRNSIFISLKSIVRGALLIEDPGVPQDFFVVDIVDTDWFVRCQGIFRTT